MKPCTHPTRLIRFSALLLTLALMLGLCSCTAASAGEAAAQPSSAQESAASVQGEGAVRTVTDVWNREVEIPETVDSIVCVGSMAPRFAAYLDVMDLLAGAEDSDLDGTDVRYDYSPVYADLLQTLPSIGAGGGSGENNAYPEQILAVMPDVILAGFSAEAADELQRQTGIPVVSVRYRTQGFLDDDFYSTLRLFAEVVGAEERCEEVLSYLDTCRADLESRTADVPDEEKKSAYTGAVTFNGRHGFAFTYVNFPPFAAIHANNVADVFLESATGEAAQEAQQNGTAYVGQNGFEVDLEQILAWDPDIIFLDPGNMDLVNEEYAKNPGFFESLRAVQEGELYTMPSSNAAGPNITYLLINAYYAGTVLYPDRFADVDLEAKAGEIMTALLGEDFFDEMEAGGLYYGKITLGE